VRKISSLICKLRWTLRSLTNKTQRLLEFVCDTLNLQKEVET
jgi:hypothetical protein